MSSGGQPRSCRLPNETLFRRCRTGPALAEVAPGVRDGGGACQSVVHSMVSGAMSDRQAPGLVGGAMAGDPLLASLPTEPSGVDVATGSESSPAGAAGASCRPPADRRRRAGARRIRAAFSSNLVGRPFSMAAARRRCHSRAIGILSCGPRWPPRGSVGDCAAYFGRGANRTLVDQLDWRAIRTSTAVIPEGRQ